MYVVDSLGPGLIVWPHSVLGGIHMKFLSLPKGRWLGLSTGEWLEVVIAVHLVAVVWFLGVMAVIGIIETFGS